MREIKLKGGGFPCRTAKDGQGRDDVITSAANHWKYYYPHFMSNPILIFVILSFRVFPGDTD